MLLIHETHEVRGEVEGEFDASLRDAWMPALGCEGDARLVYALRHAHGTGVSYNLITYTVLRDGAAWARVQERVDEGDLREVTEHLDSLRHDVSAKVLIPLPWSPMQSIDLDAVSTVPEEHLPSLFMEDTVWPREGLLERYVERSGTHYAREIREGGNRLLQIAASFRTAYGAGKRNEIVLWQKVVEPRGLVPLLMREVPEPYRRPGTWMHDALELRDRWQSRLLRTTAWSPWH